MTKLTLILLYAFATLLPAAVVVDRIVAVMGRHAIKQSDIERDLRVTQFLNQETADFSIAAQKKALDRLIDQELIRADMAGTGNLSPLEHEAAGLLNQIIDDRFGKSKAKLDAELSRRNLKQEQLVQQLQWQLVVLRFIDNRFRAGVFVSDEQVRQYYDSHQAELARGRAESSFEALAPKVKENLIGDEVNRNLEEWLAQARKAAVIDYKVASFR